MTRRILPVAVVTGAAALVLAGTVPASADYAPSATDVVSVGGDTPQFDLQFVADGDVNGDAGYNAANNVNKLVVFGATADGNARQAYANGSTEDSPVPLNPTITLRAGMSPVQRPQSSGAALNALLADKTQPYRINYVFAASLPTAAQQTTAANNGWGFLHVVQDAKDAVVPVVSSSSNAPAGLSVDDLLKIYNGTYTKWNQIPGNSGGSTSTIVPLLPPNSSSITKTFLADLKVANNGNPVTVVGTKQVEQNDPSAITSSSSPNDAIVPFSSARLGLYKSGYFHDPSIVFPGGGSVPANVQIVNGGNADGNGTASYSSQVNHYVIFRQSSNGDGAFQPGGSQNWVQALFSNPGGTTPFVATPAGRALIAASGATPQYNDLGNVSAG